MATDNSAPRAGGKLATLLFAAGILLFAALMFAPVLKPGRVLLTTDDNIGAMAMRKSVLPGGFLGWWNNSVLSGLPEPLSLNWTNLLLWLLPAKVFTNWIHAVDLALASFFLALFLRRRGIGWTGCALAVLGAFWVGSNFTLTYAGHIGKFGLLVFAAAALWLIDAAAATRHIDVSLLAGGAVGAMFLEQADVALFVAMALGPYAVYAIHRERGWDAAALVRVLAFMAVAAGLVAFHPLWVGYRTGVKGVSTVSQENPQKKWEFATQWSWPPEESIDFVAPGFYGWRSGEREGPYWGRMGRSAEWETTRRGFQNFKLENQYLGAIPVVLAAWALAAAGWFRRKAGVSGGDVFFWGVVAAVSLLLSFGKHFPLYRVFYALPLVSSIRNPNKFLHVFQIAVGVLSAYGAASAAALAGRLGEAERGRAMLFVKILFGAAAVMGFWTLMAFGSWGRKATRLAAAGWGDIADVIVRNQVNGMVHGAILAAVAAGALLLFFRKKAVKPRTGVAVLWALAGLVAGDAVLLSRHYVHTMPKSLIAENDVIRYLQKNLGDQRTVMVTQDGFYNAWLTYLFPYHGIRSVNVTQMPRMPEDYSAFLAAVGSMPIRMWELMAAGYLLAPVEAWSQMQKDSNLRELFQVVYAFNVVPSPEGGAEVVAATAAQPGRHVILQRQPLPPHFGLLDKWAVFPDDQVLKRMAAPDYVPYHAALVAESTAEGLPASEGAGTVGDVLVQRYESGYARVKVSTDRAAILRIAERYDPDWRAYVGGKRVPLMKCDHLFQGIYITPGLHEIELRYSPALGSLWIQLAGMAVCAAAAASAVLRRKPRSAEPAAG